MNAQWFNMFLSNLCVWCPGEGSAFLSFTKGDLIRLDHEDGKDVMSSGWCLGICERSGEKGDFPAECVYVLPAITRPPPEVLVSRGCCCPVSYSPGAARSFPPPPGPVC